MPFKLRVDCDLQKMTEAVLWKGAAGGRERRQVKGEAQKASYFEGQTVDSLIYEVET